MNLFILQLQVKAYHTLFPEAAGTATVLITVVRNPSEPRFENNVQVYERTIDDTYPPGNVVVPVRASDPDGVRLHTIFLMKVCRSCNKVFLSSQVCI